MLLVLLVVLAVVAIQAADLLLAVVALGGYGFVMALVWATIGAVDVAFTEAVVGAGATTVFMLAALLRTARRRSPAPGGFRWINAFLAAVMALLSLDSLLR
jgi:multicomponent Na+:H+ antiporter subunit B